MNQIFCPHCEKAFTIDEAGYADLLKQVRDREFHQELHERMELVEQDKRTAVELAETRIASELHKQTAAKDGELRELKARLEQAQQDKQAAIELAEAKLVNDLQKAAAAKDTEIQALKARLAGIETAQQLAITQAVVLSRGNATS